MNSKQSISQSMRQRGMTLLELLIAMTIGLLLLVGILVIYVQTNQSYRVSDSTSRLQESARFAFDLLSREIRMAGYMGCFSLSSSVNVIAAAAPSLTSTSVLEGFDAASPPAGIAAIANTDIIRVRKASSLESLFLTGNMASDNANIQLSQNPHEFAANDVLIISDCSNADIFCATNVSEGNVTIAH